MDSLIHWLHLDSFAPHDLLVVFVLVILEGLLSCDNAVVLALLVKRLPPEQRGKALRYGIIGAYIFLVTALALASWIMSIWWLKVGGGIYLLWLAVKGLQGNEGDIGLSHKARHLPGLSVFWSTVVAVELTDMVFSVDSIAVAVALSDKLWVLILGGMLAILTMRFAAQGFVRLLEIFPRLEAAAFIAVGIIGLKLLIEFPADVVGRSHHFPEGTVYATAEEYDQLVAIHSPPLVSVEHVLNISSAAAPEPKREIMEQALKTRLPAEQANERLEHEFARAESSWNLHHRPFIEVEGWVSSLIVLMIFGCGFLKRADEKVSHQDGT